MISVEDLHKRYPSVHAVRGVSFEVSTGSVVGVLGPNGAGKSTTLRICAGFLGATSGRVLIDGHDVERERVAAARKLGYMPETSPLYHELRVAEYLRFRAALKQLPRRKRKAEVARVLKAAQVEDMAQVLIGHLSKGYRQRVGLADALLGSPPLLILDEPTAGLDPNQIVEVRGLLAELREEHTILLSTHIMQEVEAVCDRAIVIHRGKVVAAGTLDELRQARTSRQARALVRSDDPKLLRKRLRKLAGVAALTCQTDAGITELNVTFSDDSDPQVMCERLVARLVELGAGVRQVTALSASLEEVFAQLTLSEASATDQEDGDEDDGDEDDAAREDDR